MGKWLSEHWQEFWRSGLENLYTSIWRWVFAVAGAAVLAAGYLASGLSAKWHDRFIGAFVAILLVVLVTLLKALYRRRRNNPPLLISADEDAEIMQQRLYFHTHLYVLGEPTLMGTAPFIEFLQPMINASVLSVTFDSEIEGRIYIDGEEQKDKLEIRKTPPQRLEVQRAAFHQLTFRQWFTPEIAKKIQEQAETVFDFGHVALYFSFEHRGHKRTLRKALGNQVVWKNPNFLLTEAAKQPAAPPEVPSISVARITADFGPLTINGYFKFSIIAFSCPLNLKLEQIPTGYVHYNERGGEQTILDTPQLDPSSGFANHGLQGTWIELRQYVPVAVREKIITALGDPASVLQFYFDDLIIMVSSAGYEAVRLPLWNGLNCSHGMSFGRIVSMSARIAIGGTGCKTS